MSAEKNNMNQKRSVITGTLSVLCVVILAGATLLNKEPETEFIPEYTETSTQIDTWEEKDTSISATVVPDTNENQDIGTQTDQTQVVVYENETETVTNLSDSIPKEEAKDNKPTEKPVATGDITNPDAPPTYEPSVPQASEEPSDAPTNTPENNAPSGETGMVYDPVFGWIQTGDTNQDTADNGKDINKQIGNMGN